MEEYNRMNERVDVNSITKCINRYLGFDYNVYIIN